MDSIIPPLAITFEHRNYIGSTDLTLTVVSIAFLLMVRAAILYTGYSLTLSKNMFEMHDTSKVYKNFNAFSILQPNDTLTDFNAFNSETLTEAGQLLELLNAIILKPETYLDMRFDQQRNCIARRFSSQLASINFAPQD